MAWTVLISDAGSTRSRRAPETPFEAIEAALTQLVVTQVGVLDGRLTRCEGAAPAGGVARSVARRARR